MNIMQKAAIFQTLTIMLLIVSTTKPAEAFLGDMIEGAIVGGVVGGIVDGGRGARDGAKIGAGLGALHGILK